MNRQLEIFSTRVLKLTFTIILPLAVLVGGIMLLFYHFDNRASFMVLKAKEVNTVGLQKEAIIADFDTVATDLIFLARTAHLHHIYLNNHSDEIDHIAEEFETFARRKGLYTQVRYIGLNGHEVVRVNYSNGKSAVVAESQLQNKSERYYFTETVSLGPDDVYVSAFDLNVEKGKVEYPYKPIIRFSTPVFENKGEKKGVLVLNYMGSNITDQVERLAANSIGSTMLLNSEGYWLHAPDDKDEWGFLLEKRKAATFANRYPEEWLQVQRSDSGQFRTGSGLVTFVTVHPYKWDSAPSLRGAGKPVEWKLLSLVDSATLSKHSQVLISRLLFTYVFLFIIIVVGAWYTAYAVASKKFAEIARRESEVRYRMVHTTSLDSIIIADSMGIVTEANPRTAEIFGYSHDELVGMDFVRLIPEKHVAGLNVGNERLLHTGTKSVPRQVIELGGVRKSGGVFPVEVTVSTFKVGTDTFFSATLRDITRRKFMEGTLKESEAMYRGLVTTSQNLIWRCDNNGVFTYLNPAWEKTLGYRVSEMLGRTFGNFQTAEAASHDRKAFYDVQDRGHVTGHETVYLSKDSQDVYLVFNALPMYDKDGTVVGRQGTANDITEYKRLEKGLRTLSHAIEQIPTSVIITDVAGIIEYVNPKFSEDIGYSMTEVIGSNVNMLNTDLQSKGFYNDLRATVLSGAVWQGDVSYKKKSGEVVWQHVTVSAILGTEGSITHLLIVKIDDTERKRAEEALKKSEQSLAEAQRIAHVGNWDWDIASNVVIWSNEAYRVYGFDPHSVKADYGLFMEVVHPDDRVKIERRIREALNNEREYQVEHRIIRADGETRTVFENGEVEFDENGKPVRMIGTVNDITERNMLEAEVLKAQKLESIGVLAGGIAHDFNNILTAVLGNISMAKITLSPDDPVFKRLAEAEKATEQAQGLTQHLLTFSKGGAPVKAVVELGSVVRDAALFALQGSNVRFVDSIADDLWPTEVDEGQIVQVVNNLIINAGQSMPEGGDIHFVCENVVLSDGAAQQLSSGEYIRITVEDYGCGIDEQSLSKVFDPYYTAKKSGTGLGLAATYSIIEKHGGLIEVDSTLGVGTTFRVYLKASKKPVSYRKHGDSASVMGSGRILVMDDEEVIRDLLTEMLLHLGYEVETTKDGAQAVVSYRAALNSGTAFDAVIMDLTIPGGMGGRETIKELLELDPDVCAIVSSGYSNDRVMAEYERYGFSGVMSKPYMVGKLSVILNKAIKRV